MTNETDSRPRRHAAGQGAVAHARVLVVDDVPENRELLVRRLARLGVTQTDEAVNGQQALEKLDAGHFDLVLLDIMMPIMTGYEVLQRLNAQGRIQDLPVIVISALSEVDDIANCIKEGAEDFLLKPFNSTLLRARILSSLEKKFLRDHTRQELQRKQAELAVARTLQLALVPPPASRETAFGELSIDLVLDPAKEVGGDLVDHFALGEHLHVLILGDVSDKGAGAALVMARTCALFRGLAGRHDALQLFAEPELAMAEVNEVLAFNNPSCIFVTLMLATLDTSTGRLCYVRAGHVPSFLRHADGGLQRLEHAGGVPFGVLEGAVYASDSVVLQAGDCLLSLTDGVTEAVADDGTMFGDGRVADWLADAMQEAPTVAGLLATVREFEGGAPPSDDVAIMLVQWGRSAEAPQSGQLQWEYSLDPAPQAVSELVDQLLERLPEHGVEARVAHHVALALDELLTNLSSHAGADHCRVKVEITPERVSLVIEDQARPFDPRQLESPDTTAGVEERPIGGLGVYLTLSLAQGFDYCSEEERNLTMLWFARGPSPSPENTVTNDR